ncbi:hypothetical protein D3C86_1945860 [compost metagenome]
MAERDTEKRSGENQEFKGEMTVREAGQKGGERVKELVEEGKEQERGQGRQQ